MDWFLYDIDLRHERVKQILCMYKIIFIYNILFAMFLFTNFRVKDNWDNQPFSL